MNRAGFTLIEMMVSIVVMAIVSVGVAQFAAVAFGRQATHAAESRHLTAAVSALPLLERDLMYAGFGLPAGTAAFSVAAGVSSPTSNDLVVAGLPLAGPRRTPWTYLLAGAAATTTLEVRCFGRAAGGAVYPDPLTDVVADAAGVPVQLFNYVGRSPAGLPAGLTVDASSAVCTQSGVDYDGDGEADWQMSLVLSAPISAAAGTLVLPVRAFPGGVTTAVDYFVWNRRLWRRSGATAGPLLDDVEAFQVQFGFSATDGTFAPGNWGAAPRWQADLRQRAVRYQIVFARDAAGGFARATYPGLNFTYDVAPGTEAFVREDMRRTVYTPNALFAHP